MPGERNLEVGFGGSLKVRRRQLQVRHNTGPARCNLSSTLLNASVCRQACSVVSEQALAQPDVEAEVLAQLHAVAALSVQLGAAVRP